MFTLKRQDIEYTDNKLHVKLLNVSPLWICSLAGRTCVNKPLPDDDVEYIKGFVERQEESVIEHIVFSFHIANISRALLQELVRHRLASYSVLSTRWTLKKIMEEISNDESKATRWFKPVELQLNEDSKDQSLGKKIISQFLHFWQIKQLTELYKMGVPISKLKYFIPECMLTSLVMTINARSLRNMFKLRLSKRAWEEFRDLCKLMLSEIPISYKKALFFDIDISTV